MSWFQRDKTTYRVVQIQNGRRSVIAVGMSRKQAERDAAYVNQQLELFKLLAPSGPQDAHAIVEANL